MRIKEVRELITGAVLAERERCALLAEKYSDNAVRCPRKGRYTGGFTFWQLSREIRSANPPSIKVIRPETAKLHPEQVTPETIVAGQGLVGDEIVDRKRMSL